MLQQVWKDIARRTAVFLVLFGFLLHPAAASAKEAETLPPNRAGEYSFYLSEQTPYARLSPHRCETVDLNGHVEDRRICALYVLADLRRFGGQTWEAETDGYSAAYSLSPQATIRSGSRYALYSPEQAGLSKETAEKLRALISVAYPFCTAEQMCAKLVDAGALMQRGDVISAPANFTNGGSPATISESELLTAVQTAIWSMMSEKDALRKVYTETASAGRTARTLQPDTYSGKDASIAETDNNIQAVYGYLMTLGPAEHPIDAPLTGMTAGAIVEEAQNRVKLRLSLNGTVNGDDALALQVGEDTYALCVDDGDLPVLQADADGGYTLLLSGMKSGKTVQIRLSGTQHTQNDVCLYLPENGDVTQALVGTFGGSVDVALAESLTVDALTQHARVRCVAQLTERGPKIALEGASFDLYHIGTSGSRVCIAENILTDAEGLAEVRGLRMLQTGEHYAFVQTKAPTGYVLPKDSMVFADTAAAVVQENRPLVTATAELQLLDDGASGIPDVEFLLSYSKSVSDTLQIGTYVTDAAGRIRVSGLPMGRYVFCQQTHPEGFAADTELYEFVIDADGEDALIVARNFAYRSIRGSVRFEGETQPGSVVVRLLRDGAVCAEQTVSKETDWAYCFSDLPVNAEYIVRQQALPGYRSETDPIGICNRMRTSDIALYQTGTAGTSLKGTVFSLQSAVDGRHICTTASDADGCIRFCDLPVGSYLLKERRAPTGYRAIEETLLLVVTDPNTDSEGTLSLQAKLQTAEGKTMEGLVLSRQKRHFLSLWARLWIPAAMGLMAIGAIFLRRFATSSPKERRVYSGRTKLYPFVTTCKSFGKRIFGKH